MDDRRISRRDALIQTGSTLAAIAFFQTPAFAWARPGETTIPFLDQPPAPPDLRQALATVDRHVTGYIDTARIGNAA